MTGASDRDPLTNLPRYGVGLVGAAAALGTATACSDAAVSAVAAMTIAS